MSGIFSHRAPAPPFPGHYSHFRPYIREDFVECCAYCLLHELIASGMDNFQLDHFRPKSRSEFKGLTNEYCNLYYACSVCNRYKSSSWPSDLLVTQGYRFIDPCQEVFTSHFAEENSGRWRPLTRAAEYTEARLRLNRPHLTRIRRLLAEIAMRAGVPLLDWDQPAKEQIARLLDP